MNNHVAKKADVGRFASLLASGECPRPLYDKILFETQGCVITPTLGSIIPDWILIIPRTPVLNFAHWQAMNGILPSELVQNILAKRCIKLNRAIWFEHGPSGAGTSVGCGIDQAHLHVIIDPPFSFPTFISSAMRSSELEWRKKTAAEAHRSIEP